MLANQSWGRGCWRTSLGPGACWRTSHGRGPLGELLMGRGPVGEPLLGWGPVGEPSQGSIHGLQHKNSFFLLAQCFHLKTKSITLLFSQYYHLKTKSTGFLRYTTSKQTISLLPSRQNRYVFVLCSTENRSTSLQKVPVINCDRTEKPSKLKRAVDFFLFIF